MTDVPNTQYITINQHGVFVGGKIAKYYRGKDIENIDAVKVFFSKIQRENPEIKEMHVGAFALERTSAKYGMASGAVGPNVWGRVKLSDGRLGPWVFGYTYESASVCVGRCAVDFVEDVCHDFDMRSAVLNTVQKQR